MKTPRLMLLTLILTIAATNAVADGGFFAPEIEEIFQHEQIALVQWDADESIETLTVLPGFRGDMREFAWVVPVPAEPEVSAGDPAVFDDLFAMTRPLSRGRNEGWSCEEASYDVASPGGNDQDVTVLLEELIGVYQVMVLAADNAPSLVDSLDVWGYLHDGNRELAEPILADYVAREWVFVTVRTDSAAFAETFPPEEPYWDGGVEPIELTFPVAAPIYPMRISAVSTSRWAKVSVFTIAAERFTFDGAITRYANRLSEGELAEITRRWPHAAAHLRAGQVLTRLEREMGAADMDVDVALVRDDDQREFRPIRYSGSGDFGWFLGGTLAFWLVARWRLLARIGRRRVVEHGAAPAGERPLYRFLISLVLVSLVLAGGLVALVRAQSWQPDDGVFNPSGVPSLPFSQPRFADLDQDGDQDLVLGGLGGGLLYLRNDGSAAAAHFVPGGSVLDVVDAQDAEMAVFGDLDQDGDLDLIAGGASGLQLYRNTGSPTEPQFARVDGFFAGLAVGSLPVPALADLDADLDLDLVVGLSEDGRLKFYRNTGTPAAAVFGESNAEFWFDVGLYSYPWLCDLDGDDDLDLVVGRDGAGLHFYRNDGDPQQWLWHADHAVLAGLGDDSYWNSPCVVDLTDDDRLDLVHGTAAGPLEYFENTGSITIPEWTADASLFGGVIDVGGASSPFFHDLDGDGDLDLVSGSQLGDIVCLANVGTAAAPAWQDQSAAFASIDHSIYSAITLGDVDGDGLSDAIVGDLGGQLFFYRNTRGGYVFEPGVLAGLDVGGWSVPRLVDLDGDEDLDLAVGAEDGTLSYWRNEGSTTTPDWVAVPGYFAGIDVGSNASPTFGDLDADGDVDLVAGNLFHELHYFARQGGDWVEDPDALAGIAAGQNAAPALGDLDGDGDLDLAIGNYAGTLDYFENLGEPTSAPDDGSLPTAVALQALAAPNPFNPATRVRWVQPTTAPVSVTIYDLAGRRVRTLRSGVLGAGAHEATWRGVDERGRIVGSGVYLCRIRAGEHAVTVRLVCAK
jgi:hypothetical protein